MYVCVDVNKVSKTYLGSRMNGKKERGSSSLSLWLERLRGWEREILLRLLLYKFVVTA